MNEGHSAFMVLERIQHLMTSEKLQFDHALEAVKASSVFTTHTPVPAGNDTFDPAMIKHYFDKYAASIGISMDQLLALGRQDPSDNHEPFNMTVLALRTSSFANGVAKLHGETARAMWSRVWPGVPVEEIPITSITNGVHPRSWISRELAELFDLYVGPAWKTSPSNPEVWEKISEVPDAELWRTHERRRERLVGFARRRLVAFGEDRGAGTSQRNAAAEVLDPEVLTIGIARRFAAYKRLTLLFSDPQRVIAMLHHPERSIQLIISGKAHPQDTQGKELIRQIVHFVREHAIEDRVVFLEDYDINVARHMVQGVDCWLNTPRRPLEASGTSGMKAAANGVLNFSILDGWWAEAWETALARGEPIGWSIDPGHTYQDDAARDAADAVRLYELLEQEIIPSFFARDADGLPHDWLRRMRASIRCAAPEFSGNRMVSEYVRAYYLPAAATAEQVS
jgi:starch phosphorylase